MAGLASHCRGRLEKTRSLGHERSRPLGRRMGREVRLAATPQAAHANVSRPRDIIRGIVAGRARFWLDVTETRRQVWTQRGWLDTRYLPTLPLSSNCLISRADCASEIARHPQRYA